MIPPNAMERARLAFWNEDGNLDMKLNAAFRSLSAAWPVADGRIREASDDDDTIIEAMSDAAEAQGWNVGRDDRDERHAALAVMRLMLRAARRASAAALDRLAEKKDSTP